MKIRNVVHKGFRRFIEDDNLASLQPAVMPKLRRILSFLQDMEREQQARRYWTAMLTVLDVTPPMVIATSTASPVGVSAGICTSTRYSPTEPVSPEKLTGTSRPPIVARTRTDRSSRLMSFCADRTISKLYTVYRLYQYTIRIQGEFEMEALSPIPI